MMDVRDDQVPAGAQHAGELGQHRREARHVDEGERADDDVYRIVRERQPVGFARLVWSRWFRLPIAWVLRLSEGLAVPFAQPIADTGTRAGCVHRLAACAP